MMTMSMARANPEHNFFGIERLLGRVSKVCRKVARENLKNARVFRLEVVHAVSNLLPADSIAAFHLLFPDPWPKRRHHRRRAFTTEFLSCIHRALIGGGLFHIATDHADYFRQIERVIAEADTFVVLAGQHGRGGLRSGPSILRVQGGVSSGQPRSFTSSLPADFLTPF